MATTATAIPYKFFQVNIKDIMYKYSTKGRPCPVSHIIKGCKNTWYVA